MSDISYKYPAQLSVGDILIDNSNEKQSIVKDISVYTCVSNGEPYKRCTWVQVDSAIYTLKVLYKKFESNEIQQLIVIGNVLAMNKEPAMAL